MYSPSFSLPCTFLRVSLLFLLFLPIALHDHGARAASPCTTHTHILSLLLSPHHTMYTIHIYKYVLYMHIYIFVCVHMCIHIYTCAYIYMHIPISVYLVCKYRCIYVWCIWYAVYVCIYSINYPFILYTCVHTHIYNYIHNIIHTMYRENLYRYILLTTT